MKLDDGIRDAVRTSTLEAYRLYMQQAHPWRFDPVNDIYRFAFTEEAWQALQLVLKHPGLKGYGFDYATAFKVGVASYEEGECYDRSEWPKSIAVPLPENTVPILEGGVHLTNIPDEIRYRLEHWIKRGYVFDRGADKLAYAVRMILRESTTVGHVVRLWPVLQHYLPHYAQEAVENRKARSPIPPGAFEHYWDCNGEGERGSLKPEFDMRRYATIERILIGAALIEGELDDRYPTFYS